MEGTCTASRRSWTSSGSASTTWRGRMRGCGTRSALVPREGSYWCAGGCYQGLGELSTHALGALQGCRLEVERLQREVHRLRGRRRTDDAEAKSERLQPFEERLTGASRSALSDRIMDDKLLRLLHVQVESVALQGGGSSRQRSRSTAAATRLRRSFLQDNVFCRLSLDPAALPSVASTENTTGAAEHWDDISRRVGRVCSEIVASCCYALDVEDVAKLPRRVEALQCVAHIAPVYQAFAESVKHQLQRFGKVSGITLGRSHGAKARCPAHSTSCNAIAGSGDCKC